MDESSWDVVLTTSLHLGSLLSVSGALLLFSHMPS